MAKSFKYKDNNFLDSTGIVHNQTLLSDIFNCSNDEIAIGKTQDGKTIYKKELNAKTPSFEGGWGLVVTLPKNIRLKKFYGMLGGYLPFPTYVTSDYYISAQLLDNVEYTGIQLYVKGYTNMDVEISVEYIKIND